MPKKDTATREYDDRRTLIIGDINTGKTRLTVDALASWIAQGRSTDIVVLDLAPETNTTIGGRILLPAGFQGVVLAPTIVPPRLTGRNEEEADRLARDNAVAIEALLPEVRLTQQSILVINDATLYLQAGRYERLMAVIQQAPTALINAYYGHSFPDYQLSRQERRLTDRLIEECDRVIRLPHPDPHI